MNTATTTDGAQVKTVKVGFTARFVDGTSGLSLSPVEWSPNDAAAILAMAAEVNYAGFRAILFAAKQVRLAGPVNRESVSAYFTA